MHTIFSFALSRLKLSLSFLPFHFAAPCSLHRCSSAFRVRFTHSFEFLNAAFPRATALLLYTLFLILSTLFLVEDFYWILSINCVIYTKQVVFNRFFRKMRGFLCWNGVRIVFLGKTLRVRFGKIASLFAFVLFASSYVFRMIFQFFLDFRFLDVFCFQDGEQHLLTSLRFQRHLINTSVREDSLSSLTILLRQAEPAWPQLPAARNLQPIS